MNLSLHGFIDELEKIAVTRGVKEWRAATAGGDQAGADQIAKGYGQLGAKPRYLEDISMGGAEAGVDKMMGRAMGPEANESGYVARKLYKPDGYTRGEFTPRLMEQKKQLTDEARGLSPEAKNMVPAMYGHQTMGEGPMQRTVSQHEYVPGMTDIRGKIQNAVDGPGNWSRPAGDKMRDLQGLQGKVLKPMAERGHAMADTIGAGINYGNVAHSPTGPKIVDFLPKIEGGRDMGRESLIAHADQHSMFDGKTPGSNLGALRKEVFNPQTPVDKVGPEAQEYVKEHLRKMDQRASMRATPAAPVQAAAAQVTRPTNVIPINNAATRATTVEGAAARAALAPARTASGFQHVAQPALAAAAGHEMPTAVGSLRRAAATIHPPASATRALGGLEAHALPGLLRRAGSLIPH